MRKKNTTKITVVIFGGIDVFFCVEHIRRCPVNQYRMQQKVGDVTPDFPHIVGKKSEVACSYTELSDNVGCLIFRWAVENDH